ncbi:hypothetical protein Hanom_Chr15g01399951 [Helianthus anomalus]
MQFRVWVEEEFSNWVPDSVGSVDVSEESGSEGSSPEVEVEPVRILIDGDTNGLGSRKNTEKVGDVPVSKSAGPPHFSGGTQGISHEEGIGINDSYFFKSREDGGPKKRRSTVRPRIKNKGFIENKSPILDNRPRKRMRDEGVFSFDLNKQTEVSQQSQHPEYSNYELQIQRELQSPQDPQEGAGVVESSLRGEENDAVLIGKGYSGNWETGGGGS